MLKAFLRLKAADWIVVLTGLAVIVALEFLPEVPPQNPAGPDVAAQPAPRLEPVEGIATLPGLDGFAQFGPLSVLRVDSLPPNPSPARAAFDKMFKDAAYFGAFAMNDGGAFGYTLGYATAEAARRGALGTCAMHGANCGIIAELFPADMQGDPPSQSLSYGQAQFYLTFRQKPHPAAVMTALDGAFGGASADTTGEAINNAFTACQNHVRRNNGLNGVQCEVLKVWD